MVHFAGMEQLKNSFTLGLKPVIDNIRSVESHKSNQVKNNLKPRTEEYSEPPLE